MKIKIKYITPVILGFFVAGIAGTIVFNIWSSEQIKEPAKIASGEFKGENDPTDIRGSFTLEDINKAFNIPVEDLAKAFGFGDSPNPEAIKAKDIEETYGSVEGGELGTDSVRMFVAYYLGLPFSTTEDSLITKQAIAILKAKGKITEEQLKGLEEISIDLATLKPASTEMAPAVDESHEEAQEALAIKGNTTFEDLLNAGATKEEIENILGIPMGRSGDSIRDYVAEKDLEFSEFKLKLQELVDTKK